MSNPAHKTPAAPPWLAEHRQALGELRILVSALTEQVSNTNGQVATTSEQIGKLVTVTTVMQNSMDNHAEQVADISRRVDRLEQGKIGDATKETGKAVTLTRDLIGWGCGLTTLAVSFMLGIAGLAFVIAQHWK